MPVRKIPKSYRSLTGRVASAKNNGSVAFESSLERDLMLLLEFDSCVLRYEEQPVKLEYLDKAGKRHTYTPDLLITYRTQEGAAKPASPILCEVKYRQDLFKDWPTLKPKFKAARAFAKTQGWRFVIFTEKEIRTPLLSNIRFLLPYQRHTREPAEAELLLKNLNSAPHATPETLLTACTAAPEQKAALLAALWHLVATAQVGIDLHAPLNMQSPLWSLR